MPRGKKKLAEKIFPEVPVLRSVGEGARRTSIETNANFTAYTPLRTTALGTAKAAVVAMPSTPPLTHGRELSTADSLRPAQRGRP